MEGVSVFDLNSLELVDLVALAQSDASNNSRAMNEIVRRYQPKAIAIARQVCFDSNDHDDVAQVALLALVQAVRGHDPERDGFKTYAKTTMTGAARRYSMKLADEKLDSEGAGYDRAVARESRLLRRPIDEYDPMQFGELTPVVEALPAPQRELLVMRFVDDMTPTEIAHQYGVTVSAISQRMATAKRAVFVGRKSAA